MRQHKSLTEKALEKRRDAYQERRDKPGAPFAPLYERQANELLALRYPPDVGAGGEIVREQTAGLGRRREYIRNTLQEGCDRTAEDASIRRTDLLLQPSFNAVAMGIDAAESVAAANSHEKMLCHQMAVAHEASMRLMDRALSYEADGRSMSAADSTEACRLANTAARLMNAYQSAMLTLHKLRTGGNQTVTVQHVNVEPGGQAVIGNVRPGGTERGSDS